MIIIVRSGSATTFGARAVLHLAAALGMDYPDIPVISQVPAHWFEPEGDARPALRRNARALQPTPRFRPVRQPGLSGKRTRQSQKLHNRRAA